MNKAIEETTQTAEEQVDGLTQYRIKMFAGDFDDAKRIEREAAIPPHIVQPIVNTVFEQFLNEKKFKEAISIGAKYEIPAQKIADAIYEEFRFLVSKNKFEEALNWGMKNNLAVNDITRVIVKWIEWCIINHQIDKAIALKNKHTIASDQISNSWQKGYNRAFDNGEFYAAALLSKEFGLSERKTLLTAIKAFKNAIKKDDAETCKKLEADFNLFNDHSFSTIGDEEGRQFINLIEENLTDAFRKKQHEYIIELVDGIKVLYKPHVGHLLKGLVRYIFNNSIDLHGSFLHSDDFEKATMLKNRLVFFEESVPVEMKRKVFDQVVEYHNKNLKKNNLELGLKVKEEYQLLGFYSTQESLEAVQSEAINFLRRTIEKGEFKLADKITNEYALPTSDLSDVAKESIGFLIQNEKYNLAFDLILKYKVDTGDFELLDIAKESFKKCMKQGYYDHAANIGLIFDLKNPVVKEAARIIWERFMSAEEYEKARAYRKKFRLQRRVTKDVAKIAYDLSVEKNKYDLAKQLRQDYSINIGFFDWLMELIRKILALFLSDEKKPAEVENGETVPAE